jgi:hypothetical protein
MSFCERGMLPMGSVGIVMSKSRKTQTTGKRSSRSGDGVLPSADLPTASGSTMSTLSTSNYTTALNGVSLKKTREIG